MNEQEKVSEIEQETIKDMVTDTFIKQMDKLLPKLPFKVGRNQKCICGSGKKFKFCCINRYQR